jgi:hypothetical protein
MLGIGEYSGRLSMVIRSSGHISREPTLEGPEYVLHHRLRLQPQQTRLLPPTLDTMLKTLPCLLLWLTAQYSFDALLESVDAATVAGKKTLAHLRCCTCQGSATWLTAPPMAPVLEVKDAGFRAAMQYLLGMSPLP